MAGFGDYTGYNRPYGLDPHRETNDLYDTRYQQIYGYHTPVTEEFQGPPLVMDENPEEGLYNTGSGSVEETPFLINNLIMYLPAYLFLS